MAYIYQIINDINDKVYIGKTEFSIERRFQQHCRDCNKRRCEKRPLYAAMRKYGIEHFHIELIEETNNPEEREQYWIEQLDTYKNRYNATKGGDGKHYLDYDLIIKTYQELQNIEEVAKVLKCDSHQVGMILRQNNIPIKSMQQISLEKTGKPVAQCDKETGEIIKIYPSAKQAGREINGKYTHISEVANGKRKSAYGFSWKFV